MLFRVSPVFSSDGGAVVHFVVVQVPLQKKEGSEVRDFGFGCCRKEVCVDSLVEMITFVHWSNCSNMMSEVYFFVLLFFFPSFSLLFHACQVSALY